MAELILRTRLEILRSNLRKVEHVDSIDDQRRSLMALTDLPRDKEIRESFSAINSLVTDARNTQRRDGSLDVDKLLNQLEEQVGRIESNLRNRLEIVDEIRSRLLEIRDGRAWMTLQDQLVSKARTQIQRVEEIKNGPVAKAAAARLQKDQKTAQDQAALAWTRYLSPLYGDSQQLFTEHLDLLSGLALRETGFDLGMCRIADALILESATLPDYQWSSLTIPTQQEALNITVARIIRLGFPEWTIWALPLTAHEFGYVAVDRTETISKFLASHVPQRSRTFVRTLLADAFATWIMGPAYACAAILIRLDPRAAWLVPDGYRTNARLRVILRMLSRLDEDEEASSIQPYTPIVTLLEREWKSALLQVRPLTKTGARKPSAWAKELALWAEESNPHPFQDDNLIASVVKKVADAMGSYRALSPSAWPRITDWSGKLTTKDVGQIEVRGDDELRAVLNAAWLRRIELNDPDDVDDSAKAVRTLLEQLVNRTTPPTSRAPQPGAGRVQPKT
jgi:hypothetical protein